MVSPLLAASLRARPSRRIACRTLVPGAGAVPIALKASGRLSSIGLGRRFEGERLPVDVAAPRDPIVGEAPAESVNRTVRQGEIAGEFSDRHRLSVRRRQYAP